VEVEVDPATAFTAFTEEIGRWWVPGPINNWDFGRAVGKRIEPGVGGRVLELYADDTSLELGRVTVWEPGRRLTYLSSVDETQVDVRFAETPTGTRVSVEHSVLPGADVRPGALFFPNVLHWLVPWCRDHDAGRPARRLARTAVGLYYRDPAAAARWLVDAFGLTTWDKVPAEGERPSWLELNFEGTSVLLFQGDPGGNGGAPGGNEGDPGVGAVTHGTWLFVDDLDAHLARAGARGATIVEPVTQHGFRSYTAADPEGHRWTFVQASPAMISASRSDPWPRA
jgi:uncharacterized glyoxalase superfamily protein PhnB